MAEAFQYNNKTRALTKTVSITSGKGGVGKSSLVSNLAVTMAAMNKKVLVLDGDFGMANIDVMFGHKSSGGLLKVVRGEAQITDIIQEVSPNVSLIPGGSGIYELQKMSAGQRQDLIDQISQLEGLYDVMLIDTAPGIDDHVLYLNSAAQRTMVVLTPDPSSLTDAYALIKMLNMRHRERHFDVVCNMVKDDQEAVQVFKRLADVCAKFLDVGLDYAGFVPMDLELRKANKCQQLISKVNPRSPSGFAIRRLAEKIESSQSLQVSKGGLQFFWNQVIGSRPNAVA